MSEATAFMALTDLVASFEAKEASPVDAVRTAYRRIDRYESDLNAFCHLLDGDEALAAAREAEERWAQGTPAGPLDGVPITVKDALLATGWAALRGSKLSDPDTPDTEDSPAVARVREAGAIVIGKTTMPEFGWKGVNDSPLSGITRNPWDLSVTPGGSSGGSAAALAAGIGNAAIGTDAGGSVRIPGSFSGLVAIKASYGRVANYPLSAAGTLSHIGPMTRTVADAALMLNVMAKPDARDPANLPYDGRDFREGIEDGVRGLRVAFSPTLGYARIDPEVADLAARAAEALAGLGAEVEQVDVPFEDPSECFRIHFFSGISHALRNLTPEQRDLIDPGILPILEASRGIGRAEYMEAIDWRVAFSRAAKRFLDTFDVLVTPTMAVPPFEVGRLSPEGYDQENWMEWSPFTYPFNLTGQPAISVPCGFTEAGLPVGLQIVGQYHDEATVLRAARAYEAAHPTTDRRPPTAAGLTGTGCRRGRAVLCGCDGIRTVSTGSSAMPDTAAIDSVTAALNYVVDTGVKPVNRTMEAGNMARVRTGTYETREMTIRNGRTLRDTFSLDETGFVFVEHETATEDFFNPEDLASTYYPEVERLIAEQTGAKRVLIFDHTLRSGNEATREERKVREPVTQVHNDYTEWSGPQRVRDLLPDEAEELLKRRFAIVQVWRAITKPIESHPLAIANARSLAPEDLVASERRYPDRVGETYQVSWAPDHEWYYFPRMTRDEALVFKVYDSEKDGRARFTAHTAFDDPNTPEGAPERESIEMRTIAFF